LSNRYVIIKDVYDVCDFLSFEKAIMELTVKHVFAVLLWILWCTLHSTLIATPVTDYLKKKLGDWFRFYRLFFNAVSIVTLSPVVYYSIPTGQAPVFRWEGPLMIVKYLLLAVSIILFIAGGRHYSMAQFLGIQQIKTGQANLALSEYDTFKSSGILTAIRHPWYTASLLFIWARDLSLSTLLINIVLSAYFVVGTILEERRLLLEFGERYREYQKNVSMFIPYKWLKARIAGKS
jgi:protein-S-isoprenylcysteine O-methyltransferase Ste14